MPIELPNGKAINPRDIAGVHHLPAVADGRIRKGDRLRIDIWEGGCIIIECISADAAKALRTILTAAAAAARRSHPEEA